MGVGADRKQHAFSFGVLDMTPVEIEALWVGVDLHDDAVLGRGVDHRFQVYLISFPRQ